MGWRAARDDGTVTEWERTDGFATVRLRERGDGSFVVRADRMTQAPEGSGYERTTAPDREAALEVAERLRDTYDVAEE